MPRHLLGPRGPRGRRRHLGVLAWLVDEGVGKELTIKGDTDLTTVRRLELLAVDLDRVRVRNQDVVSHDPSLPARVSLGALGAVASASRGEQTGAVSEDAGAPRLVEGDPVLALGHGLEQDTRVVGKVSHELLLVQHAEVALVKLIREIPVEERDHGGDARIEEVVDELDVVVQALLVDGVVASTEWDHARPGDGKAVGLCAGLLQELNVLRNAVVGIAGHITRAAASNLAWDLAEGVPDGGATAVSIWSTLNLVARYLISIN